jgi:alkylation response protein AidB-like acyl-CoA dehydrogenase
MSDDDAPSFVRGLFAGAINDTLLFPFPATLDERDPDETRTVRRLLGALDRMSRGLIDPARFDEEERIPEEVIEALASEGFLAISIPREYGGLGLSPAAYAHVFGAVSSLDPSIGVLVAVHCGLSAKAIVLYGTHEQKERYLPMLARGETLGAYALTEPETGSDAQHIVTRARLSEDGTEWILDGRKHWIGNGQRAGVITTFAQTEVVKHGETVLRPTAFIIRPDMPGFRVVGTVRKMGIRGSTQAELAYEGLRVPADHVLGTVGKGFTIAVNALNAGRMSLASGCNAGSKRILAQMREFTEARVQFGHPIADFEITQRKLARTATDIYASDAMLAELTRLAESPEGEYALEAACCKVFASDMLWRAADEMVQLAGGRGFVKPWPYERMLRDSRINRIFEGTNEILRLFISLNGIKEPADRMQELGVALRQPLKNLGLLSEYAASRLKSRLGATPTLDVNLHARLRAHAQFFEKHVAELKDHSERLIFAYRKEIVERQQELERLANMAIELFATACVLARTQQLLEERGEAGCERELALCDLFVVEAGRRFRANRLTLQSPQDETRRLVARHVREAGGYGVVNTLLHTEISDGLAGEASRDSATIEATQ